MTQNSPVPNPENPETQISTDTDISVNGQSYNGLDELPPELQDKVKNAMSKLESNPNLANILSSMGDLAKSARQNGIGVSHLKNIDRAQLKNLLEQHLAGKETILSEDSSAPAPTSTPSDSTPASFENQLHPVIRNMPMPSSTYNPTVKGDGLRKAIFIAAIILVVGYLIVKFGYNGKLPF